MLRCVLRRASARRASARRASARRRLGSRARLVLSSRPTVSFHRFVDVDVVDVAAVFYIVYALYFDIHICLYLYILSDLI